MRIVHHLGGTDWQLGPVSPRRFDASPVDDRADVTEWLPASVPGNVRSDLLAQGRIPDPFFSDWYKASLWVEDRDWWYRRSLDVSIRSDQRAFLVFHGIDYLSAVFLSAEELGRHTGMFGHQVFEITDFLSQAPDKGLGKTSEVSHSAEVAVRIWGSAALPGRHLNPLERAWKWLTNRLHPGLGAFPDRAATLKCQMSFGWDFAPPMRAMGIWDDVWLVVTGGVFIEDVWVQSQLPDLTSQSAHLAVQVMLDSDKRRTVQVEVQVIPSNFDGSNFGPVFFALDLPEGCSTHTLDLDMPHPRLWEPWDRGFPHLYELTLSVSDPQVPGSSFQFLDSTSTRFGIRHIALDGWTLTINGRREFVRGVNWVPADSLPGRLQRDDYGRLLGMAHAAGTNLIRVWGGGLREKRAFYDICDELGLLVWQEFPFACDFLGYFLRDARWLELVERECTAIVRATRNHPALALWCGGNEFSPGRNRRLVQTLARVVAAHDNTRPFIPASPSAGDAHSWDVWHGKFPLQAYRAERAGFLSEFGLQAVPSVETLRACLPENDLWPPGEGWVTHKAELGKLRRYVEPILSPASSPSRDPGSRDQTPTPDAKEHEVERGLISHPQDFIAASQQVQALGLQIAIEHMRRRKGETGGVCLWQFNEPWPAISWAIVDYWRRPKLAYHRLEDLFKPVLVGLTFSPVHHQQGAIFQAQVWAVNDSLETFNDCQLQIELDSVKIYEAEITLTPDSVQVVGQLCHQFQADPNELTLALRARGGIIARNRYDMTYYDPTRVRCRDRMMRWLANAALR